MFEKVYVGQYWFGRVTAGALPAVASHHPRVKNTKGVLLFIFVLFSCSSVGAEAKICSISKSKTSLCLIKVRQMPYRNAYEIMVCSLRC